MVFHSKCLPRKGPEIALWHQGMTLVPPVVVRAAGEAVGGGGDVG
jgi:hypothetical protein